jgi:hypothetical protein
VHEYKKDCVDFMVQEISETNKVNRGSVQLHQKNWFQVLHSPSIQPGNTIAHSVGAFGLYVQHPFVANFHAWCWVGSFC